MRSLIVYHSHSGHTTIVAYKFLDALNKYGEVDIFELNYSTGDRGLFRQILDRIFPARIDLGQVPLDVKDYDLLCLGIPVWVGRPAPLVDGYIQECKNITGKKIICFAVCGVQASAKGCLEYVKKVLTKKGDCRIIDIDVPWLQATNSGFVDNLSRRH